MAIIIAAVGVNWFDEFVAIYKNINENVLVVTHSGVINIFYHLVNGIEWNNQSHIFKSANCSIHILDVDAMRFEVENKNDFLLSIYN